MSIGVSKFLDVSDGLKAGQFSIGERTEVASLSDLDPIYRKLMDEPVTAVLAVMGSDGRPNLTAMWFAYEGDKVLVNVASHRKKVEWIRANPQLTIMLLNPANPYHWMTIKCTVEREISEDDPEEGGKVSAQLDRAWTKYTGNEPPYGLRDPSIDERRVQFVCGVDRIATFGQP
jgi:PPOX class probable F420-dependent enzyme